MSDFLPTLLSDVAELLNRDIEACFHCDYGRGSTGLTSEGEPCEGRGDTRALRERTQALAAEQLSTSDKSELCEALRDLVEVADLAPAPNCSCHLSAPCGDCVEWSGLRDALSHARGVLTKYDG